MTRKVKRLYSDLNVDGSKTENAPPNIFLTSKERTTTKKNIRALRIEDDSTTYNDEKIMEAIERYYKILYTCTTNTHNTI